MAAITIHPTNIRGDALGTTPATIVGDPSAVWSDGSDATYTETNLHIPSPSGTWNALGDVQYDLPAGASIAVTGVSIRAMRSNSGGAVENVVRVGIVLPGDAGPELNSSALFDPAASGSPYFGAVHTASLGDVETLDGLQIVDPSTGDTVWSDPVALADLFRTGFTVALRAAPLTFPYASGTYALRVYEVAFTIEVLSPCYQTLVARNPFTLAGGDSAGDAATLWGDGSDTTYAILSDATPSNDLRGVLDAYTGRTVVDLGFDVRLSVTGTPSEFTSVILYADGVGEIASTAALALVADGVTRDFSHTFTPDEMAVALADVRDMLSGGLGRIELVVGTGDVVVTLYEVSVRVGHKCVVNAPPCRVYPRDDALGSGSGRVWPPPKSQQASNRRAGGYY